MKGYIEDHIKVKNNGCWEWQGTKSSHGYGVIRINYKLKYIHRLMWYQHNGDLKKDLQIDHLCRNRICCNPDHLQAVTQKTNILRGISLQAINKRKTHCKHGHEFTIKNTIIMNKHNHRKCRICHYNNNKKYRDKKLITSI